MELLTIDQQKESFLMNKIQVDTTTDCWNWRGYVDKGGYGRISLYGKQESAHRVFYALKIGPIPRGKAKDIPQIDHLCKNRRCCNPEHLELVSFKENILRGDSPSALHAKQVLCKRGHTLPTYPNYYRKNSGRSERVCLICRKEIESSLKRIRSQRKARLAREQGPRREELLKKHRDCEKKRREKIKFSLKT